MNLAAIPSPPSPTINLGSLMIHYYALFVLAGILAAAWLTARRWAARGGQAGFVADATLAAVPFGILGGRLYHVVTSPQAYFGPGGQPWRVLAVWDGGLGVWGAIAGGAVGVWLACRRAQVPFPAFAGAAAPAIAVGQAIGRIGCYFNQELYGRPTSLPWAIIIDPVNRPAASPGMPPTIRRSPTRRCGISAWPRW